MRRSKVLECATGLDPSPLKDTKKTLGTRLSAVSNMADVNRQRVTTRSRQVSVPGDISWDRPSRERLNRSRKAASSTFGNEENGGISRMELGKRSDTAVARTGRKRRKIIYSESEDEDGERTKTKKTRAAIEQGKNKKQALSKGRELRVVLNKSVYDKKASKDSSDEEGSSEKESGMASSYVTSSSSSSSEEGDSDSPVPTSELSDSSFDYESFSSYESSGNEDITWRIRKSPRKKAQADSRKKIAALRSQQYSDSEDNTSTSESESSYHSDD